jgi:hypothetical protein
VLIGGGSDPAHRIAFPTFVGQAPGDNDTFYVLEKGGRVQIVRGGAVVGTLLDISDGLPIPDGQSENGLLGLAFHPEFASNGRYFVRYTTNANDVLDEYHAIGDTTETGVMWPRNIYTQPTIEPNHNGGMLAFWPESGGGPYYLYATVGDGGGACDSHGTDGNGQNLDDPHGKLHRFDVDGSAPFGVATNPFASTPGRETIWAYGLRNPWRFAFDRGTGDIYIGDVGQEQWEEVDFQPASSAGGENYGWRLLEGFCSSANSGSGCTSDICTRSGITCDSDMCISSDQIRAAGLVPPVFVYSHNSDPIISGSPQVIIGGYVYRGTAISGLQGWYLFCDGYSGGCGALQVSGGGTSAVAHSLPCLSGRLRTFTSFGQDNAGEPYVVGYTTDAILAGPNDGIVLRIIGG